MDYLTTLAVTVAGDVWATVVHNWPYLLASVIVASIVQVYLDPDRLSGWLRRRVWLAVLGAVALGTLTPFCSCGTTAVVLGALASSVPWAPIVAFMASSPLTSPEEYLLSVGLFGPAFATTFFVAAIAVGLLGGAVAWWLESRGHLAGQARLVAPPAPVAVRAACCATADHGSSDDQASCSAQEDCRDGSSASVVTKGGGVRLTVVEPQPSSDPVAGPARLRRLATALGVNARRMAIYFVAFATIGYLIIRVVPTTVIINWLGAGNPIGAVPLAALLGIPVYLNTDASLPLVAGLLHGGMAPGAAIAFLITGAGTSIGSITGLLVIARWRIVALVILTLLMTAVATGWLAGLWL